MIDLSAYRAGKRDLKHRADIRRVMEVLGAVGSLICLYACICHFRYGNTSIILDLQEIIYDYKSNTPIYC